MRNIIITIALLLLSTFTFAESKEQAKNSNTKAFSIASSNTDSSFRNRWRRPSANPSANGCKIDQATENAYQKANSGQRAIMDAARQILNSTSNSRNSGPSAAGPLNITIPTVVHVVHNYGPELIGEYQIVDAIDQMNEDFAAWPYAGSVDGFGHLQADVGFTFKLAQLDPWGNPTNGITYTQSTTTYNGTEGPLQSTINWPREMYLNVWVVNSSDGTGSGSAYSNYPSTVDNGTGNEFWDGIVVSYWAIGRTGTAISTHHKIMTHEAGHWANLKHTWGDQTTYGSSAACSDDDGVADTPNTSGNGGCASFYSCGSWDNAENFMDYGNCSTMFTFGQSDRMQAALLSTVADRNNLWTTANLVATGLATGNLPPVANANGPYYSNVSTPINFSSAGSSEPGGVIVAYHWNFGDGNTSTQANPSHSYASLGSYNVTLTVTDDDGQTATDTTTASIIEAGNFITFESEPNDSASQANGYVGPISPVSGAISSASDTDWFFFEVTGSGSVDVRVDILGTYADLDMWVYHESDLTNFVLEGYTDDPSRPYEQGSFNATQNGIYYINVDGWSSETSDYSLQVTGTNIGGGSSSGGSSGGSSSGGSSSGGSSSGGSSSGGSSSGGSSSGGCNQISAEANGPYTGTIGTPVNFSSAGSCSPDGGIVELEWDFGNGGSSTQENPNHTYNSAGSYEVVLLVIDGAGNEAEVVTMATITDGGSSSSSGGGSSSGGSSSGGSSSGGSSSGGSSSGGSSSGGSSSGGSSGGGCNSITAEANGPYTGSVGTSISFSSAGSCSPAGGIVDWEWDFGDGSSSTQANPRYTFNSAGTYEVVLLVVDGVGDEAEVVTTVTIYN